MRPDPTGQLVAITGSVNRAYTLAILSGTRVPRTAYRIAKLAGLSPPNVYLELRRLEKRGLVQREAGGWVLISDRVRALCEGTGPLFQRKTAANPRLSPVRSGRPTAGRLRPLPDRLATDQNGRVPRILREFSQSPTKNALLRAAGLRESEHGPR